MKDHLVTVAATITAPASVSVLFTVSIDAVPPKGEKMDDKQPQQKEVWASGLAYEPYVGRWSRLVAREFLDWRRARRQSLA